MRCGAWWFTRNERPEDRDRGSCFVIVKQTERRLQLREQDGYQLAASLFLILTPYNTAMTPEVTTFDIRGTSQEFFFVYDLLSAFP